MKATIEEISRDLRGYVNRAAAGETITIEDNGKPVASLVGERTAAAGLPAEAAARGWRMPARPKRDIDVIPLVNVGGKPASEMVIEDRR